MPDTVSKHRRLYVPRFSIRRIPHLQALLPAGCEVTGWPAGQIDAVAGWGVKPTAAKAAAYAQKNNLPFWRLEDGFLRSFGLGVEGAAPLSLITDLSGIYYDSRSPSDLETMIEAGAFDTATLARAAAGIAALREERLSKYNKGLIRDRAAKELGRPFKRLIIDQTAGDASVMYSGASQNSFTEMVEEALETCAAADIGIKLHPDTMAGKKGGYLRALSERHGIRLIDTPYNPWDLFAMTDEVATLSSQMGFEALMAGKKVLCHGMPFYAGWGLTTDKITCPRRNRRATLEEIFAAAYLLYPRYINPATGERSTFENTVDYMSDMVRYDEKTRGRTTAVGFSPWKMTFIPTFLSSADLRFRPWAKKNNNTRIVVWAGKREKLLRQKRIPSDTAVSRMEDGFIRSKGLGAKLVRPWSLVLDNTGIYYDPRTASDLEIILNTASMPDRLLKRAAAVQDYLVQKNISKYNTGATQTLSVPHGGRPVILVPGQVEDDASILTGTRDIKTNLDLLKTVRAARPDAFVIYKPHPDVEAGKRKGKIPRDIAAAHADMIVEHLGISSLWPVVDEIHTLTSLTGFEGLLRDKKVACYGIPFYAGWGLTQDYYKNERRTRKLTIKQLVAGALILYPLYIDWPGKAWTTVETVIDRLASSKK